MFYVGSSERGTILGLTSTAPIPFNPNNFSASVVRWYSGDSYTGTVWTDLQGSGHSLTSATPPQLGMNIFNGKPALNFDGTTSLSGSDVGLPTGDLTMIAVVNCTTNISDGSYQWLMTWGTQGVLGGSIDMEFQTGGGTGLTNGAMAATWGAGVGIGDNTQGWAVVAFTRSGSNISMRVNRDNGASLTLAVNPTVVLNGAITIGDLSNAGVIANAGNHFYFNGSVRHLIVVSGVMSDASLLELINSAMQEGESPVTSRVLTTGNDSTATRGGLPFLTVQAAINASTSAALFLRSGGFDMISIGAGTFASNTGWTSRLGITGAGKPNVDNSTTPTMLVGSGATILRGASLWEDCSDLVFSNFGVDSGSAFIGVGSAQECLLIVAGATHVVVAMNYPKPGIVVSNICCLNSGKSVNFHAFALENTINHSANNIDGWYGFAGLVHKTINGTTQNCTSHLNGNGGIYIKSSAYGICMGTVFTNCASDRGAGLFFDLIEESLDEITINGFTATGCDFGMSVSHPNAGPTFSASTISGLAISTSGPCDILFSSGIIISGAISTSTGDGIKIESTCDTIALTNLVLNNNTSYGVNNLATDTTGHNVTGTGNGSGLVGGNALIPV